jgi:hypothetical protein
MDLRKLIDCMYAEVLKLEYTYKYPFSSDANNRERWLLNVSELIKEWVTPIGRMTKRLMLCIYKSSLHKKSIYCSNNKTPTFQYTAPDLNWLPSINVGAGIFPN